MPEEKAKIIEIGTLYSRIYRDIEERAKPTANHHPQQSPADRLRGDRPALVEQIGAALERTNPAVPDRKEKLKSLLAECSPPVDELYRRLDARLASLEKQFSQALDLLTNKGSAQ